MRALEEWVSASRIRWKENESEHNRVQRHLSAIDKKIGRLSESIAVNTMKMGAIMAAASLVGSGVVAVIVHHIIGG